MFGKSNKDEEESEENARSRAEEKARINELRKKIGKLEKRLEDVSSQMEGYRKETGDIEQEVESQLKRLEEEISGFDEEIDSLEKNKNYSVDKLEREMDEMKEEIKNSIHSIRNRQTELEAKVNDEYRPELEKEQELLNKIMDTMQYIQDRLTAYGRIKKKLMSTMERVDELETDIKGKVGQSEFEDFRARTREQIKRLKSQFEMLEERS